MNQEHSSVNSSSAVLIGDNSSSQEFINTNVSGTSE